MQGAVLPQWRPGRPWVWVWVLKGLRPLHRLQRRLCRLLPALLPLRALKRLAGVALTFAVLVAVALVGQAAGRLTAPHARQLAGRAADGEARLLAMALRQLPVDQVPAEARFEATAAGVPSELLSVEVRSAGDAVLTVRLAGSATAGAFGGRRTATVVRCYTLDWQPPQVGDPVATHCPDMPQVPAGALSGAELAAGLNEGTSGERIGPTGAFATGQRGACAFAVAEPSGRVLAWPAPVLAPCTTDAAREAAGFLA